MAADTVPLFKVPAIQDNPGSWGPAALEKDKDAIPYASFNKADKIGKAADWQAPLNFGGRYSRYRDRDSSQSSVQTAFNFFLNDGKFLSFALFKEAAH